MHMLGQKRLDMVLKYAHPSDAHKRRAILKYEEYQKSKSEPSEQDKATRFDNLA